MSEQSLKIKFSPTRWLIGSSKIYRIARTVTVRFSCGEKKASPGQRVGRDTHVPYLANAMGRVGGPDRSASPINGTYSYTTAENSAAIDFTKCSTRSSYYHVIKWTSYLKNFANFSFHKFLTVKNQKWSIDHWSMIYNHYILKIFE